MAIKKFVDVLSPEKTENIKNSVRELMNKRYGDVINIAEIAIGDFYNGVALIYIGHSQENLSEDFECAQLAINLSGDFIKFKIEKGQEFYGFETYDKDTDTTLIRFELRRAKDICEKGTVSTEDFRTWEFSRDKYVLSDNLFCSCLVKKGDYTPQTEEINCFVKDYDTEVYEEYRAFGYYEERLDDEFDDEEETKIVISDHYFIQCWGATRAILHCMKLNTNHSTQFVIHNRYILLRDNMREYMPDDYFEYDDPDKYCYSYYNLFARYNINSTDILKNRYGVFDILAKKIIIHVGEMGYVQAMISGFSRLDFLQSQEILTYDYFDSLRGKGIPYKSKLSYDGVQNIATSCIDGHRYNQAANIITEYWGIPETRSGKNTGEWYIIREGKHAGRTLCWLLANDKINDIVSMINTSYLSFDNFHHFTYPSSYETKKRNKIWLALDKQMLFEEIHSPDDVLELEDPFNRHNLTKHQSLVSDYWGDEEPNFEQLVEDDTEYLVGLINNHCLIVDSNVFEELKDAYEGNNSYLSKLRKIQDASDDYRAEIEEYEENCREEMQSRWEEEEQRYWQNEGYRSAFEDDPDAEWNID